jgi:hypothetical protein
MSKGVITKILGETLLLLLLGIDIDFLLNYVQDFD